jgi:hypothetical protein
MFKGNLKTTWDALEVVYEALSEQQVGLLPNLETVSFDTMKVAELMVEAVHKLGEKNVKR